MYPFRINEIKATLKKGIKLNQSFYYRLFYNYYY